LKESFAARSSGMRGECVFVAIGQCNRSGDEFETGGASAAPTASP
jgi:hypothetical protein